MTEATRDLIVEHKGSAGLITLNRPEALNALTHDMARGIRKALERWSSSPSSPTSIASTPISTPTPSPSSPSSMASSWAAVSACRCMGAIGWGRKS